MSRVTSRPANVLRATRVSTERSAIRGYCGLARESKFGRRPFTFTFTLACYRSTESLSDSRSFGLLFVSRLSRVFLWQWLCPCKKSRVGRRTLSHICHRSSCSKKQSVDPMPLASCAHFHCMGTTHKTHADRTAHARGHGRWHDGQGNTMGGGVHTRPL